MNDLICGGCGHPYRDHFAGGTCIARHPGEASVCPCLAWNSAKRDITPAPPEATERPLKAVEPAPEPSAWFDRRLACTDCGRTTYRLPLSREGCAWCGGALAPYTTRPELAAA